MSAGNSEHYLLLSSFEKNDKLHNNKSAEVRVTIDTMSKPPASILELNVIRGMVQFGYAMGALSLTPSELTIASSEGSSKRRCGNSFDLSERSSNNASIPVAVACAPGVEAPHSSSNDNFGVARQAAAMLFWRQRTPGDGLEQQRVQPRAGTGGREQGSVLEFGQDVLDGAQNALEGEGRGRVRPVTLLGLTLEPGGSARGRRRGDASRARRGSSRICTRRGRSMARRGRGGGSSTSFAVQGV